MSNTGLKYDVADLAKSFVSMKIENLRDFRYMRTMGSQPIITGREFDWVRLL